MCGTAVQQAGTQFQTEVLNPINENPYSAIALATGNPMAPLFMNRGNKSKDKSKNA